MNESELADSSEGLAGRDTVPRPCRKLPHKVFTALQKGAYTASEVSVAAAAVDDGVSVADDFTVAITVPAEIELASWIS